MTLETFKAQARRLQAFLKSNSAHAQGLSQAKHASCLEAVAAVHGARNWNTLQGMVARAEPVAQPGITQMQGPPDLAPAFAGLSAGDVQYVEGCSGSGKTYGTTIDIVAAVGEGYHVTVLDCGRSYHHLALALNGVSSSPAQLPTERKLPQAGMLTVEFEGWLLTEAVLRNDQRHVPGTWAKALPYLHARAGHAGIIVVDEAVQLQRAFGEHFALLGEFLRQARASGAIVSVIGQSSEDFVLLRPYLGDGRNVTLARNRR